MSYNLKTDIIMTTSQKITYLESKCKKAGVPTIDTMPLVMQMLNHSEANGIDVTEI